MNEGTVLKVEVHDNRPQWGTASVDAEEADRRKEKSIGILADLKKRDPGGDIEL